MALSQLSIHASKRARSIHNILTLSHRTVFQFAPTSTPEGLQHYELLHRQHENESKLAIDILKKHGYLNLISLRNIDEYPLSMDELRTLRYKLNVPFQMFIDPPLFEDGSSTQTIEEILIQIINGYKPKKGKNASHDRLYSERDEYSVLTPIFYHKKEHRGILARPADKIMSIVKPTRKDIDHSYYGDEDKRYQVFGTQWHKKGSRFYDNDDGFDWNHVNFDKKLNDKEQEKTFKNWNDWGELEYVDENVASDPNDMDSFYYRTPRDTPNKRRPWH